MTMTHPSRRWAGLALALALAAGCNSGNSARPQVQGHVTYHGAPVANRMLVLVFDAPGADSFSQMLPLAPDGSFSGEVPQPGTYKVVIAESLAVMEGRTKKPADDKGKLPDKYKDAATSDLSWTVDRGSNQQDFELKD